MKTCVYSWRVDPAIKSALEEEARRRGESLAELLDVVMSGWLRERRAANANGDAEQERMRATAQRTFGAIAGGDPGRSRRARQTLRKRLEGRRALPR